MKKLILSLLLVSAAAFSSASPVTTDVVGVWVSNEHDNVIGSGTMTLTASGAVTLAPDGFDPLKGSYKVQGQFIDIKTEQGRSSLAYKLKGNLLTVEYENGSVQHFTKAKAPAAKPENPSIKKVKKQ